MMLEYRHRDPERPDFVSFPSSYMPYVLSGGGLPPRFFKTRSERDAARQEEISYDLRHAESQKCCNQIALANELAERERMMEAQEAK